MSPMAIVVVRPLAMRLATILAAESIWVTSQPPDMSPFGLASAGLARTLVTPPQRIVLLIGPEGGLEASETRQSRQYDFLPVTLGPRILRTETAAITAIAVVQALWGDL